MSRVQTSTSRSTHDVREQLRQGVREVADRGRLLDTLRIMLLCVALLAGGLFVVAIKDAVFDLPGLLRVALLAGLVLISLAGCIVLGARPWLNKRFGRAAGEQIDRAANAQQQPVTVGLSLQEPMDDDSLALVLLERAQSRAADVAAKVQPKEAYPLRRLVRPAGWFALAIGLWLLLAMMMPNQFASMFARVVAPWSGAPPFSLTQLQPSWTPEPPTAGEDVVLTVEPTGLMPKAVDWVLLDEQGDELERFAMVSDGQDGFRHVIRRVQSPIEFRLEANGRHTRSYTITPTPRAAAADEQPDSEQGSADTADGQTNFDPDKVARRDLNANRDWPVLKANIEELLNELRAAQAKAQSLDPDDADKLLALADELAELADRAKQMAGELSELQGELPEEASALLDALANALLNMQTAALPDAPTADGATANSGEPTPGQWLKQAAEAAQTDQKRIGQGVGPSDLPTRSGTASGQPDDSPAVFDPSTSGTYREANASGDTGPLPDAVMQQVPPSYRDYISAYFARLVEEQDTP